MNYQRILSLQKQYGYDKMQGLINTGMAWELEGSVGRAAMGCLESGACMLPKVTRYGYYGNKIPMRDALKPGSKGTYQNCKRFWEGVEDGSIFLEPNED